MAQDRMFCHECGENWPMDYTYCPNCVEELHDEPAPKEDDDDDES